jgi:internalin A
MLHYLSPLKHLTKLNGLRLDGNQISDISPLVDNSGLGMGDTVWLDENNLDLEEGSDDMRNIKILEDRGVKVFY